MLQEVRLNTLKINGMIAKTKILKIKNTIKLKMSLDSFNCRLEVIAGIVSEREFRLIEII